MQMYANPQKNIQNADWGYTQGTTLSWLPQTVIIIS
jgi:hypothetical protein